MKLCGVKPLRFATDCCVALLLLRGGSDRCGGSILALFVEAGGPPVPMVVHAHRHGGGMPHRRDGGRTEGSSSEQLYKMPDASTLISRERDASLYSSGWLGSSVRDAAGGAGGLGGRPQTSTPKSRGDGGGVDYRSVRQQFYFPTSDVVRLDDLGENDKEGGGSMRAAPGAARDDFVGEEKRGDVSSSATPPHQKRQLVDKPSMQHSNMEAPAYPSIDSEGAEGGNQPPPPPPMEDRGILRESWWISLGNQGQYYPETRRSHSATLYKLPETVGIDQGSTRRKRKRRKATAAPVEGVEGHDRVLQPGEEGLPRPALPNGDLGPGDKGDGGPPQPPPPSGQANDPPSPPAGPGDGPAPQDEAGSPPPPPSGDNDAPTGGDNEAPTEGAAQEEGQEGEGDSPQQQQQPPSSQVGNGSATSTATSATNKTMSNHTPSTSNTEAEEQTGKYTEYMIVSGGFTDEDWSSFPVYAYDVTSSQRKTDEDDVQGHARAFGGYTDQEGKRKQDGEGAPIPPLKNYGTWVHLGTRTTNAQTLDKEIRKENHPTGRSNNGDDIEGGDAEEEPEAEPEEEEIVWPPGRVGHVTAVSPTTGNLYVFGGMTYYDREFHTEAEAIVWKASGVREILTQASSPSYSPHPADRSSDDQEEVITWERIVPQFAGISESDNDLARDQLLPRGETAGGLWIDPRTGEEYLVFHGGLHVTRGSGNRYYNDANGLRGGNAGYGNSAVSVDVPLGDVWAFHLGDETFERWGSYPPQQDGRLGGGSDPDDPWDVPPEDAVGTFYPVARTAHSATITDDDQLVIYGGMAMSTDYEDMASGSGGAAGWSSTIPQWEMLDDIWAFDLRNRRWMGKRDLAPSLARSYHNLCSKGQSLVATGGFRTAETIAGESIAFVFSDTLLALPNSTEWYKAVSPTGSSEGLPHRLEHAAVMDHYGSLFVWGGRFRTVSQIPPTVYRLDLLNADGTHALNVAINVAEPDGMDAYEAELQTLHLMVAIMIFMSVMFTTLYGTLRRGMEGDNGTAGGTMNLLTGGGGGGVINPRRNGVRQDVIDTFPVKTYQAQTAVASTADPSSTSSPSGGGKDAASIASRSSRNSRRSVASGSGFGNMVTYDEEDGPCCPICLLEYEDGDEVRTLPCKHEFHKDCVDSWLWNNSSCPACRHSLSNVEVTEAASVDSGAQAATLSVTSGTTTDEEEESAVGNRAAPTTGARRFIATRLPGFLQRPVFSRLSNDTDDVQSTTPSERTRGATPGDGSNATDVDTSLELYPSDSYVGTADDGQPASAAAASSSSRSTRSGSGGRFSSTQSRGDGVVELVTYNSTPITVGGSGPSAF